jgi:hypothetical protein
MSLNSKEQSGYVTLICVCLIPLLLVLAVILDGNGEKAKEQPVKTNSSRPSPNLIRQK